MEIKEKHRYKIELYKTSDEPAFDFTIKKFSDEYEDSLEQNPFQIWF